MKRTINLINNIAILLLLIGKERRFLIVTFYCIGITFFYNTNSFAQSTIESDGLNNSTTLFTLNNGAYYTNSTDGNDEPSNSPLAVEGTHSRGAQNTTATLTSNNINTTGCFNTYIQLRVAAFGITGGGTDGMDATDYIRVEVSPNGGTNYYNTITITGNTNAYWPYSATGVASTSYDGDVNTVTFTPAGGGSRTTDGYSTIRITGIPAVTNLRLRITLVNNANTERWCVDDFTLQGNRTFYSGGDDPVNETNSWWTNTDGTGSHPSAFNNGDIFIVQNGHTMTTSGTWNVSGLNSVVRITNGGSITATNEINLSVNTSFEINDGGTYNHNNNTSAVWGGTETIGANSTINYGFAGDQPIGNITYGNLTISGSGNKNTTNPLVINNVFNASAGTLVTNNNINFNGSTICGDGRINASAGTVSYAVSANNIIAGNYYNLIIPNGANATLCSGTVSVNNTLSLNGATLNVNGSTFSAAAVTDGGANTITINTGSFSINNNLVLTGDPVTFTGAGSLNVSGNLSCGAIIGAQSTITIGGSFSPSSFTSNTSTVHFNGTGAQNIPAFNYNNLTSSSTGSRTMNGTIGISGAFTPGSNSYTIAGSTVNYNGTTSQQVASFTYNNLTASGSGTKTLTGNIIVNNNLLVSGTAILASGMYQITGNATGTLTLGAGTKLSLGDVDDPTNVRFPLNYTTINLNNSSTVTYQSGGNQTVDGLPYGNLEINGNGIKSISSPLTVNNTLILTDGYLSIGNNNLTIQNPITIGTGVIVTGGSGYLVKTGSISASSMTYPVGTGTKYTPVILSGTSGATTGSIYVRAIDGISSNMDAGAAALNKYWEILTPDYTISSGDVTLTWHPTEALGDASNFSLVQWAGGIWNGRESASGPNSLTHTLSSTVAGEWTTRERQILYSYTSGDWHTASTWTIDPSGTERIGSRVPLDDDKVVILNGYTVTLTSDVNTSFNVVVVEGGAFLNLSNNRFTEPLARLEGTGTIQSSYVGGVPVTGYFPSSTGNTFVETDGGTFEYTALSDFNLPSQATYNNLKINVPAGVEAIQTNNLQLNGNLLVNQGTFQINDAAAVNRSLTIAGNITVESGASLTVGSGNATHSIFLSGNLTNEGTVDLTNKADFADNAVAGGASNIEFNGSYNATVIINNSTSFYGFIVNKGSDQSTIVEVLSDFATAPFDGNYASNVITLKNGTLKIGENITLSRLRSGGNYDVSADQNGNAGLWVNGANVTLGTDAMVVYGTLKISMGSFNAMGVGQGAIVTREGGSLYIEGGTLTANQIRPSNTAVHTGSYIQTGGVVNINGPATTNTYPVFTWPYPTSQFHMSGGTLNISNPTSSGAAINGGILIGVSEENYSITGGTVNVNIPATAINFNINSTVPFWNMSISKSVPGGTGVVTLMNQPHGITGLSSPITAKPLTVLNNLTINGTNSPVLNANGQNLILTGTFQINGGGTYTPGTNSTIFSGSSAQSFSNSGTITGGLYKLKVNKPTGTVTVTGSNATLTVSDSLIIEQGTMNDGGKIMYVAGHIYNGGTHTGSGSIELNGSILQTIEASPFGSPSFGNIAINGTSATVAAQLLSDITVNSLSLTSDRIFDIGVYGLTVNTNPISGGAFSATRMIRTAGNSSDKGLTIAISGNYSANTTIATYPIGTAYGFTPAEVRTNASGSSGNLSGNYTIVPVNSTHPAATIGGYAIPYYWKSKTTITGATNANIDIRYTYYTVPPSFSFWFFFTAYYHPWLIDASGAVDMGNNVSNQSLVPFIGRGFLNSDYSVGATAFGLSPFNLFVRTLYSRNAAPLPRDWNDAASWSEGGHGGGAAGTDPNPQDNVIIGNNHTVVTDANSATCATLEIQSGSILDLGVYTGHTFDVVTGTGKIRISSADANANFPTGDFGTFLSDSGGIVEYYSSGVDFAIPAQQDGGIALTNYRYLELTPEVGRYIIMPNTNLEIYDNLTIQGLGIGANSYMNTAATRTLRINDDLNITGGNLQFRTGTTQNVFINGNVNVGANTTFDVQNLAGSSHSMSINGNLVNNGTFDMRTAGTCNVTFTGATNNSVTGTGSFTNFNKLTVDKGTDQSYILTTDVAGTFSSPNDDWLTLTNGTFRYLIGSDLNISTGSKFTINNTACLHINNSSANVYIANSASDDNDLYLNGKLLLTSGTINIGSSTNNNNNDIEYSGSGSSELVINGGTLNVNGQIRRSLSILGGILKYTQTSGSVNINGQNANTTRAKFEVLNTSTFTLTGGSLTLVRGGGSSVFGDLYIRPASYSTSASGNIYLATNSGCLSNETFRVDANIPLSGLTVYGLDASHSATVLLNNNLSLNGNLSVNEFATFNTNNKNLSLTGNFVNEGTFSSGSSDITTFNGGTQTLSGNNTTFCNLYINPSISVTLQPLSNITINKDLRILSGKLSDGGDTITVKGNVLNYTTHESPDPVNGGILLQGSMNQIISGNGSSTPANFGRLELNNSGALLNQDIIINNRLTLTNGALNIDDHLLTIGTNAKIYPLATSSFGPSRMIYSNGFLTTVKGVIFPLSASVDLFCPVGVNGKYTPVHITGSQSGTGTINVMPINGPHPTAIGPDNVLQYYWILSSTGLSGFTGNIYMNYLEGDVRATAPLSDDNYISGRLSGTTWTKQPGMVDAGNNISRYEFGSAQSDISGEYTAGIDTALPITVPTYYSDIVNGNWGDINSWTPRPLTGVPSGAIMVIRPGHTITLETDGKRAYKTTINGTLKVNSTIGHYLGIVDGTGILSVTEQKLPAGRYDPFFSCTGGSLEYGDGGTPKDYTLSLIPSELRRLILSGGGKRIMPNKDITVCELIEIGGTTILDNTVNNRTIFLKGSMTRAAGASFLSGTGTYAKVVFQGSLPQSIETFTGSNAFNHIEMNNEEGLTLNGPVDMKGNLSLTDGTITTNSINILYMNSGTSNVSPEGGSSSSYINGPLKKKITGGYLFHFPIGKGTRYGRASINLPNDGDWTAEYFNTGKADTISPSFAFPLTAVSKTEYWTISGPASKQAYVSLRWDPLSDIRPAVSSDGISGMKVTEFNTSNQWEQKSSSASGDNNNGTVTTTDKMNLDTHHYTLGCTGTILARARFITTDDVCVGGSISVQFTGISGSFPYTLTLRINGTIDTTITAINSSTRIIPVTRPGEYAIIGFTYTTGTGIFDGTTVTVNALPSQSNAGPDQVSSMCGLTSTTLDANAPAGTETGQWSIYSGTGGVISSLSNPKSIFNGTAGQTYKLVWSIQNAPCTPSTDTVIIAFNQAPAVTITGNTEVCSGSTGNIYRTQEDMSDYLWTITGGDVTSGGTGADSAIVRWNDAGTGQISVNYTDTNGCTAALPTNLSVLINPLPTVNITGDTIACEEATVLLDAGAGFSGYAWSFGATSLGNVQTQSISTQSIDEPTNSIIETYSVLVTDGNGCQSSDTHEISVYRIPDIGPTHHIPNSP